MSDFGVALRQIRRRARLSLRQLAEHVHCHATLIQKIEAGTREPSQVLAGSLDLALGTGTFFTDLWAGDPMKRRMLVASLTALSVAPASLAEVVRASITYQLGGRPDWIALADEYGRAYLADPRDATQRLAGDLVQLKAHLDDPRALVAVAYLSTLRGLSGKTPTEAARWYNTATLAADASGDDKVRAWVRGRSMVRSAYAGTSPHMVLRVTDGIPAVEASLARAQVLARVGDNTEARRELATASRLYEASGEQPDSTYAMPDWRFQIATGWVWGLLGDRRAAEAAPRIGRIGWDAQRDMNVAMSEVRSGDKASGKARARAAMAGLPAWVRRGFAPRIMAEEILAA